MSAKSAESYSKVCSRVLDVLATTSNCLDWDATLCTVAKSLTDMAHLLNDANLVSLYIFLVIILLFISRRYRP